MKQIIHALERAGTLVSLQIVFLGMSLSQLFSRFCHLSQDSQLEQSIYLVQLGHMPTLGQ